MSTYYVLLCIIVFIQFSVKNACIRLIILHRKLHPFSGPKYVTWVMHASPGTNLKIMYESRTACNVYVRDRCYMRPDGVVATNFSVLLVKWYSSSIGPAPLWKRYNFCSLLFRIWKKNLCVVVDKEYNNIYAYNVIADFEDLENRSFRAS